MKLSLIVLLAGCAMAGSAFADLPPVVPPHAQLADLPPVVPPHAVLADLPPVVPPHFT